MCKTITNSNYNIYINDIPKTLTSFLKKGNYSNIFILVDENSKKNCLPMLLDNITMLDRAIILEMKTGEKFKTIDTCKIIWQELINNEADRQSLFINLGGGVITDLGGYVAATFKRGIDFIHIPTTLLAQVDASVGGKVGVDYAQFKNFVGLYADPKAVFVETTFLNSLNQNEILNGFAEIIKYGLIQDNTLWHSIQEISCIDLVSFEWKDVIYKSLQIKMEIVEKDPYEKEWRKILNFGHTAGHALETYSLIHDKEPLQHGEAVAIGMIVESYLSSRKCNLSIEKVDSIATLIQSHFGKYDLEKVEYNELIELMKHDKKNMNAQIMFTLLHDIGVPIVNQSCEYSEIINSLEFYSNLR